MAESHFSAESTLQRLKDFQRRTVDYVFDRLYGPNCTRSFLVADEVGLGKTLVARGVIARALEHLQYQVKRIDVVYVCSNAAIAAQNVSRLNVSKGNGFATASRLTYLPMQVKELSGHQINFISFTPGTTFDLKSRGGCAQERAILYKILQGSDWDVGKGLLNLLQGTINRRENWIWWVKDWQVNLDEQLSQDFRECH